MNYFELHLGDYAAATAHLSLIEDGLYLRMLRRYYLDEAPLPADVPKVARLVGARSEDELAAVHAVLDEFFELRADGWHQPRCDEEIKRYREKTAKAKRSAESRWSDRQQDGSQRDGNADAERSLCERNANAQRSDCDGDASAAAAQVESHDERNALQTPDSIKSSGGLARAPAQVRALAREEAAGGPLPKTEGLPDGVPEVLWDSLRRDRLRLGQWSAAREMVAVKQLVRLAKAGADLSRVLEFAIAQGLGDLEESAKRCTGPPSNGSRKPRANDNLENVTYGESSLPSSLRATAPGGSSIGRN